MPVAAKPEKVVPAPTSAPLPEAQALMDDFSETPATSGVAKVLVGIFAVVVLVVMAGGAGWYLANLNNGETPVAGDDKDLPNASPDGDLDEGDSSANSQQATGDEAVASTDTNTPPSSNQTETTQPPSTTANPLNSESPPTTVAQVAPKPVGAKLEYRWDASKEHIYKFELEADVGNDVNRYDGTCTFVVKDQNEAIGVEEEGSGTGFVVSADGLVATCAHVVEGADRIEVVINRQTYTAKVVAIEEADDLALLQLTAQNLVPITFGDSDAIELAEDVRAVGFPLSDVLGQEAKVATGTVAGIVADKNSGKRIQIDAPINPGNSGGPVLNDFGQVIAVASARLAGSLVSSVGFAIPVNRLRAMLEQHGKTVAVPAKGEKKPATSIFRDSVRSVAYVKVWGGSNGTVQNLTFKAAVVERANDGKTAKQTTRDEGKIRVNTRGEVIFSNADKHLPFVLGTVASFFFEPLDRTGAATWQTEYGTALHRIKRTDGGFGPFGPRGFGGPPRPAGRFGGRGGPFARSQPQSKTVDILPATERTTYRMSEPVDGKVSITKSYEFTTTRDADSPFLKIQGKGDLIFDQGVGLPVRMDYQATIEQRIDGDIHRLPLKISYHRRDPAEVEKERQDAEQERTVPNPDLVNQLLAELKQAGAGAALVPSLTRLGRIAVVPELQAEVLSNVKEYRAQNDRQIKTAGERAYANWADENEVEGLKKIYTYALSQAKTQAYSRLCSFGPDHYPQMVEAMAHQHLNAHVKTELIKIGPDIEDEILKQINGFSSWVPKSALINVLEKVGTEKSIPTLEEFLSQGVGLKVAAMNALKVIRARQ